MLYNNQYVLTRFPNKGILLEKVDGQGFYASVSFTDKQKQQVLLQITSKISCSEEAAIGLLLQALYQSDETYQSIANIYATR